MSKNAYKKFITESTTWESLKPSQKKAIQSVLMTYLVKKIVLFETDKNGKITGGLYKPEGAYIGESNISIKDQYPYTLYLSHFGLSDEFKDKIQQSTIDICLKFSESKTYHNISRFIGGEIKNFTNVERLILDALNDMVDSIFTLKPGTYSSEYKKPINMGTDKVCLNIDATTWEWKHTSKQRRKIMFYNFFTRTKYSGNRQEKAFFYNLFIATREYLKGHLKVSKELADKLDVKNKKRILLVPQNINFNEDHVEISIFPYVDGCIQKRIIMKISYDDYLENKINDLDAIHEYDYKINLNNYIDNKEMVSNNIISTMTPFITIKNLSYKYAINFNITNKKTVINHISIPLALSKLIKKSITHRIYDLDIKKYFNKYCLPEVLYALRLSSYHTKYSSYYYIAKYNQYNPEIMRNRIQFMLRYPLIASAIYDANITNNGVPLPILKLVKPNDIISKIDRGESYASDIKSLGYSNHVLNEIFTKPWQAFLKPYIILLNNHIEPGVLNIYMENFKKWSKINLDIKENFPKLQYVKDNPFIFRNPIKYSDIKNTSLQDINDMHDLYQAYQSLFPILYKDKRNENNIHIDYDMIYDGITRKDVAKNFQVIGNSKFGIFESYEDFFNCSERYHSFRRGDGISTHIRNAIESARCHYKKHHAIEGQEVDLNQWPNFFDNYTHELGTLTFIENGDDLINEGKTMEHCVGGYINTASSASSFIAHIQSGEYHSTVELQVEHLGNRRINIYQPDDEKLNLRVIQNRSYRNQTPHKNCETILNAFLKHIENKSDAEKQDIIKSIRNRKAVYRDNQTHNRFYSSMALFFAMPYIKDILPRKYRKKDFQVLRDMIDYSDIENNIVHNDGHYTRYPQVDF